MKCSKNGLDPSLTIDILINNAKQKCTLRLLSHLCFFCLWQVMFQLMTVSPKISSTSQSQSLSLTPQTSDISFSNVSFQYVPGQQILSNLSFTVPSGQSYAIVGGSGSGKSTIIRLLYRFMEPSSGTITVGDRNIASVEVDSLRWLNKTTLKRFTLNYASPGNKLQ